MTMEGLDVVVVGAGLAGLAAARRLTAAGRSVVVLEARHRVGGRTENGTLADGQWVELGGQWIGPGHDRMYALVDELGLSTVPLYNDGDLLLELLGRRGRMASNKGAIPRLSPFALVDLGQGLARFDRLAKRVDLDAPWLTADARRLDGQTFRTWIDRTLRTAAGRAYFQVVCEAVFAADPADVSLLHALMYARSNTDLETLVAVEDGAQQDRVAGGSALVAQRIADALGARVVLGDPVRTVLQDPEGVEVQTKAGRSYRGRRAIVALPPTLAGRLEYHPPLPSRRDQLTQRVPAGSVIKMYLVYDRPFWRDEGLNGQVGSDRGPVKVTFDNTPPGYGRGILLGFLEGTEAREWADATPDERRHMFVEVATRHFGPRAAVPQEYLERDWMAEEHTRGCYGAHFAPGVWTAYGKALREPVGAIGWAGAEYAPEWNGYMEGAVRSGEAAADDVLAAEP